MQDLLNTMYDFIDLIENEWIPKLLKYYELMKIKKHKSVLNIAPNKTYIRDKKLIEYYCRDNC